MRPAVGKNTPVATRGALNRATASWSAAALCRFGTAWHAMKSGRGLPHSKTSRSLVGLGFLFATFVSLSLLAGCSKSAADKPAAPEKSEPEKKAGVTLDAETQERLGLKLATPTAMDWQPETKGFGRVIDRATLTAAVVDLDSARVAAEVSIQELARQKTLAAQDNASARALEAAKATFSQANSAYAAAEAKFKLEWGSALADANSKIISEVSNGTTALVRIDLPAGETLPSPPTLARIIALTDETKSVQGEFAGATDGVNPQTQSQSFFFSVKGGALPSGAAVTGFLKTSGAAVSGVVVPLGAVLRHEGKGWAYVQSETNQFVRVEVLLDRLTDGGWFVSENISTTNRVVVSGAQTILSAELSGGKPD